MGVQHGQAAVEAVAKRLAAETKAKDALQRRVDDATIELMATTGKLDEERDAHEEKMKELLVKMKELEVGVVCTRTA